MKLENITLIAIAGRPQDIEQNKKVLRHCTSLIDFEKVILLSCEDDKEFETKNIGLLDTAMHSRFCVESLTDFVSTDYCLVVQPDGFVINTSMWSEDFLNYDYIGAPWPSYGFAVGNGGFSLRSKKFLETSSKIKYFSDAHLRAGLTPFHFIHGHVVPEDWFLCVNKRQELEENGIVFPTAELAYKFSIEYSHPKFTPMFNSEDINSYNSFGFHGNFNRAAMELIK